MTYQIEASGDLATWADTGILVGVTDLGDGREQVTCRDTEPMLAVPPVAKNGTATGPILSPADIGSSPRYLRVRAIKP